MPTECVWRGRRQRFLWNEPGAMFFRKWPTELLSKHYLENVVSERPPIIVMIPSRRAPGHNVPFCIDSHPSRDVNEAWSVEIVGPLKRGQKPDITVSPSINMHESYHGFLQHGVLTDDLGG